MEDGMESLMEWVRNFLLLYLLLTILVSLAASDRYYKYLRFFSGIIMLLYLLAPVMRLLSE